MSKDELGPVADAGALMRELFRMSPMPFAALSLDGRVLRANENLTAMTGYAVATLEGMTIDDLLDDRVVSPELASIMESPTGRLVEVSLRTASGARLPTRLVLMPIRYTGVDCVLTSFHDISALTVAQSQFRDLLEVAPDAMVIADRSGTIQIVNQQTERMFGYARAELLGKPVETLIPERYRDHAKHRDGFWNDPRVRAMGSGVELFGRRKDGSEFPVEVSLSPLETASGYLVTSAIRDITERKRLERQVLQASAYKSEFLANMSHELRTPLNSIIGFADLMYRGKVGELAPDHHEYMGDILTSARHLLQLINDVLDLAKVESGKMELRPARIDLAKLVGEVRDVLRGMQTAKHLTLELDLEAGLEIVTDPSRLKQVLFNYLSNAIKFSPPGGVITVRARAWGEHEFCLEVEDRGVGIPAEDIPRLFSPFEQLDTGTAKRYQGSGLGLAVTRRVVESQSGRVGVKSEVGVGSTFHAILPRVATTPTDEDAP